MRILLVALLIAYSVDSSAHGEIVLDEFDIFAFTESPLMAGDFVTATNVGPLAATRDIRILSSTTRPTGTLRAGTISRAGPTALAADLATTDPRDRASIGFQFWYDIDATDLTEGGQNNAILIDFLQTETSGTPLSTRAFVGRANTTVETPVSPTPFTLAILFDDIGANFSQIQSLNFTVETPQPPGNEDFNLLATIDRVRVGFVVPEPVGMTLAASALAFALTRRWRSI
ncbi:MAG: hypothetical protein AAGD11_17305 [Planctomycetota bacterium]